MLFIIKKDYFLADHILASLVPMKEVRVIPYRRQKCHGIQRWAQLAIRFVRAFLFNRKGWETKWFFHKDFIQQIAIIEEADKVLFWGCENLKELLVLKKEIAARHKNVFLWNPVATICRNAYSKWEYASYLNRTDMTIYTFDAGDARRYHFNQLNQVYCYPSKKLLAHKENIRFNAIFIGQDKKRTATLTKLASTLEQQKLTFHFHIVCDKHTMQTPQLRPFYQNHQLSYEDSLALLLQAQSIIEILQKGQTGMTLRTLEAVFLQKKLITNNISIVHTPIYHPDNIYILGQEKRSLSDFLNTPYHELPQEVINPYEIHHWIQPFL